MSIFYILRNHDPAQVIGRMEIINDKIIVTFPEQARITKDQFFDIFSGAGAIVQEFKTVDGVRYVQKAQICEFSLSSPNEAPAQNLSPIKINMNDAVLVKVNPEGHEFLQRTRKDYVPKAENFEGYSRWYLSDLFSSFGAGIYPTMQPLFSPNLVLALDENTPQEFTKAESDNLVEVLRKARQFASTKELLLLDRLTQRLKQD